MFVKFDFYVLLLTIINVIIVFRFILYRKDFENYYYIKKVFKSTIKSAKIKSEYEGISITFMNVLYFYLEIPNNIDDDYKYQFLYKKLELIDRILLKANLSGIVIMEQRTMFVDEKNETRLIKFVPDIEFEYFIPKVIAVFVITYICISYIKLWLL